MIESTAAQRARTPWHPRDCTCGLCRPQVGARDADAPRRSVRRGPLTLTVTLLVVLIVGLAGVLARHEVGRPAQPSCQDDGTPACLPPYRPPRAGANTMGRDAWAAPSRRPAVYCALERLGVVLPKPNPCTEGRRAALVPDPAVGD